MDELEQLAREDRATAKRCESGAENHARIEQVGVSDDFLGQAGDRFVDHA